MRVDVTSRFRELAPAMPHRVTRRPSVFYIEAADLLSSLVELEKLLQRVKPKYLLPKCFVRTKGSRMSEADKDELDADLVELIKNCSNKIDDLKMAVEAQALMSNVGEYQKEVVAYLLERLKTIADGAKQMQKKRYQQPFLLSSRLLPEDDRQELDALEQKIVRMKEEEAKKKQRALSSPKSPESPVLSNSPMSPKLPSAGPSSPSAVSLPAMQAKPEIHQRNTSKARKAGPGATQQAPVFASQNDALEFTEEEDRRFRVENVMLHRHFQENLEDAKKMESKMAEISNLMGQFADKIMEQQNDIELIQQHAQETKSNVSQSNRILEQTQKIGKGYGFVIFCFYLGFSVILHMLHYFNS
ncbi:SNARE protein Syntaxin 18/UFE1 [Phytophthora cinnamomi]|uniref:SNARE protein Syntaxin 18/UFE1 n=1 Tax=Phytophthora cinnamomi TaxID=4785 RepID=UPI003559CC3E|nr:SNARE protein Syntaxin 18/UFE1 [Phytophthora cinnamomi]